MLLTPTERNCPKHRRSSSRTPKSETRTAICSRLTTEQIPILPWFNRGEKNGQFGKGIYFAADKSYTKENGKKVVSAYLNVENPFTVTDNTNILTAINEKFPGTDYFEMTKVLADNGYDGIIYDRWENGKIIVAFEPNQIKLPIIPHRQKMKMKCRSRPGP